MPKVKVLIIIPSFHMGGAERMATYLATYIDKNKFEVAVLSLHKRLNNGLEDILDKNNIKIFSTDKSKGFDIRTFFRLKKIIKDFNPDIIHTHQTVMRYIYPFISKNRVFIHTVHSIASGEITNPIMREVQKLAYNRGVLPVSISQYVTRTVSNEYGLNSIPLIHNGIPLRDFLLEKSKTIPKSNLGFTENDFLFINVGGFREPKNHNLLIQSFSKVFDKTPNSKLLLVGDGPLLEESKNLVNDLGLKDKVHFLGLRNDIPEILNISDVFVLSSDWEGYPLCLMEAMAAGLPVISTNVGGVPEIVSDKISGLLVSPGNAEELSNAMLYMYNNSEIRKKMGEEGKKIAFENFSIEKMCKSYEELYLKLLCEKGLIK